jgi:site-specific DNA-methyltransferase (adenine-specific)
MSPSNPSLRDVTERILVASKGRFDRAIHWKKRKAQGHPWEATIGRDEFMAWTLDTWQIRPESAKRVGHPAPFPVELPRRLIELYTYKGDVVLDPFMGAGSTAVAAVETGRRYVGFDTDATYIDIAKRRIADARTALAHT